MPRSTVVAITFLVSVANYYTTTFCIWFGHWFSHIKSGPLTALHVLGHHAIYPSSRDIRSPVFRYASWKHDSTITLFPWLLLAAGVEYVLLPGWLFCVCFLESALLVLLLTYVHQEFHLTRSKLSKFDWFLRARSIHHWHHDRDTNYMVADHLWDKLMGTYYNPRTAKDSPP